MEEYLTFKKFNSVEEAQAFSNILNQINILFEIQDDSLKNSDFTLLEDNSPKVFIKIKSTDFLKANEFLHQQAKADIESSDKDHYLYSFTNDELLEIIKEPDTWSEFDYELSKKLLAYNGINVTPEMENAFKEKRIKDLSQEEPTSSIWTIFGYISAVLGGLLGIAIGLGLWKSKKTLPNGSIIFTYSEKDRAHGQRITIIGVGMFIAFMCAKIKFSLF